MHRIIHHESGFMPLFMSTKKWLGERQTMMGMGANRMRHDTNIAFEWANVEIMY